MEGPGGGEEEEGEEEEEGDGRGRPLEEVDVAVVTMAEKIGDTDRSNKEDESP